MKAEEFLKMVRLRENQERREAGARRNNTVWIEVAGFIGIEHMTNGAYLFRHKMGLCWVPKAAIKFERKINFDQDESEYRVMMASWFDWDAKIRLMKQGKLVSDDYLKSRLEAERAFISTMPKIKTPKRPKGESSQTEINSVNYDIDLLFKGIMEEEKTQPGGMPGPPLIKVKYDDEDFEIDDEDFEIKEQINIEAKDKERIKAELSMLREDLLFYISNNDGTKSTTKIIDGTRKKIFLLILEKREKEYKMSNSDKRFFGKYINTKLGKEWKEEYENNENLNNGNKQDRLNRAIDL